MSFGSLDRDERARRKQLVEDCLVEGFAPIGVAGGRGSAVEEAGRRDGRLSGFYARWVRYEEIEQGAGRDHFTPDFSKYNRPDRPLLDVRPLKPRVRVKADSVEQKPERIKRIVCIGDLHVTPGQKLDRMKWIARYIGENVNDIDYVQQIGDWHSFDSCSFHDRNDTVKGRYKPTLPEDMQALEESLHLFHGELPFSQTPSAHVTKGNHEDRVDRLENVIPELEGDLARRVDNMFQRFGWTTYEFGDFCFLEGVGFTHVPKNIMGRPYGGKTSERQIANDATFSIVYGHTHRRNEITVPKIGPNHQITVLNVGSAMPHGYVASYARLATTGWTYGIYDIQVAQGRIISTNFIPMLDLEARFA
jgi:hypothetical protein